MMHANSLFPFPGDPAHEARVLDRYFAGEASEEERQAIDLWIESDPGFAKQVGTLRYAARNPSAAYPLPTPSALWADFRAKLETERLEKSGVAVLADHSTSEQLAKHCPSVRDPLPKARPFGSGSVRDTPLRRLWPVSATLAVLVAAVFAWSSARQSRGITQKYATQVAQQATFTLDDGTRVTLAPQTTLRLARFGSGSRTVQLDGEAYFDVAHSAGVPFFVQTGNVTTQVLGTTFLIRHYARDRRVRVAVTEGKVRVVSLSPSAPPLTVVAGHVSVITDSTIKVFSVEDFTSETGWLSGKLVFDDVPLAEVLETLSRWYGYEFRLSDPALARQRVRIGLSTRSSAAALANLEQILGVNLTVVGDTITLTPQSIHPSGEASRIRTYDILTPRRGVGR